MSIIKAHGYIVKQYHSDAGDEFDECCQLAGGPLLDPLPPGRKDGVVEAKSRRLKETVRCVLDFLHYPHRT